MLDKAIGFESRVAGMSGRTLAAGLNSHKAGYGLLAGGAGGVVPCSITRKRATFFWCAS
jgi:hypothetical protein